MLGVEWPRQKAGLRMADRLAAGADGSHITYCRLCEAQCGLVAEVRDGVIVKVGPDRAHPVSEGHLYVKGPGMVSITYDPDSVPAPLKRTRAETSRVGEVSGRRGSTRGARSI